MLNAVRYGGIVGPVPRAPRSNSRQVAILGSASVEGTRDDVSLEQIIFECARAALADAGIERDDLDGIVLAASDLTDGRAISSMLTSGPAGAYLNDEINIASSPGHAFAQACMQIESGVQRLVLLGSWGKASELAGSASDAAELLTTEPFFERDIGLSPAAALGMQALVYRRDRPDAARAAASIAARSHNASRIPAGDPTIEPGDVAESELVADPLRALELAVPTDGAFVLILAASDRADAADRPKVAGIGWYSEGYRLAERELARAPHLRRAVEAAFAQAGVKSPREIDLWELHDMSADAELIAYEAVGLAADGEGPALALSGATGPDGEHRVNPLGGALGGEPPFGGPLRKLVRATASLQGEAGVPRASRAFVQISTGFAGQFQTAVVLEAAGA